MLVTPSYGGVPMFGDAVKIEHTPSASANQIDAFFGQSGQLSLFGGTRGRTFLISGVFAEVDITSIAADFALIYSYQDGIARTLIDTIGRTWANVIFTGQLQEGQLLPAAGGGWVRDYKMAMTGLS